MKNWKFGCALAAMVAFSTVGSAQDLVGRIGAFRGARVSSRPTQPNAAYAEPTLNMAVRNGDGIRTARRGFAQIAFNDRSILRLSELTELIVQDSVSMRRLQLAKGALWVRVTKGSNTAIQTPVATATVRGTELLIDDEGNLAVREGMVELEANGFTIEVHAGEIAGVAPDGKPYKKGLQIPTETPPDAAETGVPELWWTRLKGEPDPGRGDNLTPLLAALPLFFLDNDGGKDRVAPDSVPEPATLLGLTVGAAALCRSRRKAQKPPK